MNLQLRKDKVFEVKMGLVPTIKSMLFGSSQLNEQQLFIQNLMESQISQNAFQFIMGSHSYNRKPLNYLIEKGYSMNPVGFGIITQIINKQKNLDYIPYWKGKPYKSKTFDLDMRRAFFNLITTGTCVYWNREVVGFGKSLKVIDTANLQETYFRGFKYRYLEKGIYYDIPEEDLIFRRFLDNPCHANGLTNFGLSPFQAAIMPIEALQEMYTADTSLLKNKGSELLISNGTNEPLLPDEVESFDDAMNERIRGAKRFGRIATTKANVQVHQLGRTIKELALWDGYKVKARDLCVALCYPPVLAGDSDANKYATYYEAIKASYTDCVIPLATILLDGIEMVDALGFETFISTARVECLQEDQLKRSEKAKTNQTAIIELNTKVTEWGYDQEEAVKMIMQKQPITEPIQPATV